MTNIKSFTGFRPGQAHQIALPESFFTELLPLIDDLSELKVTLACWRILASRPEAVRFVRLGDLMDDAALSDLDKAAVRDGLERATARGALLRVQARRGSEREEWYLANTDQGRAAAAAIQKGQLPEEIGVMPAVASTRVERPNIFALYEQTIGLLSPLIADELRDAEESYPAEWIEDAFREAARQNVRAWAYVRKILERRAQHGKRAQRDGDVSEEWRRFLRGES